ncbi:MAG: DNA/RNA non-specific endonuclease, partial [Muribaculaceae bacterium]|nr:DNA/RNA non-specific endonuclease [Muribaculaceae bacterium]
MAKQQRTSRRPHAARRNSGSSSAKWKIIPTLLILVALVGVALAVRDRMAYEQDDKSITSASSNAAGPARHYADLHLARRTGDPASARTIRRDYEGFTLAYNPENLTADWVGWELLASETDGQYSRSNKFWTDTTIPNSPTTDDYRNSGYDRGHLCPAADQKWSEKAMNDCFVMTNMTPQLHALNNGAWKTLEQKERLWAQRDSVLVIVAGPIYADTDTKRIGENGVRVPSSFYKVLLAPYLDEPRAIGFVYPNMTAPGNMADYSMSVDEVERLTGLDFFYNLPCGLYPSPSPREGQNGR